MRRKEKAIVEIIEREDYYMLPKLMNDSDLYEWAENLRDGGYILDEEFSKLKNADDIAITIENMIDSGRLDRSAIMLTLPHDIRSLAAKAIKAVTVKTPKLENWLKDLEVIRESLMSQALEKAGITGVKKKRKNYADEMEKKGYVVDFITGEKIYPKDMMIVLPEGPTKYENWQKAVELKKKLKEETGVNYSWHDIFEMLRSG